MKINKSAWSAFQCGTTSEQLKEAAQDKADYFLFWLAVALGALCFLSWEWALAPVLLAAVNGAQSFDASKLAPEIEVLENLLRNTPN